MGLYGGLEWAPYYTWKTRVEALLAELIGTDSIYYNRFEAHATPASGNITPFVRDAALGILKAIREDFAAGRLVSFRSIVTAEVFGDFLEMAGHLLDNGYKDPSASLIGAVLERGLQDLARSHNVTVRQRDDINSLNSKLAQAGVYGRLTQQNVQVWATIRNHADHGQFDQYDAENVAAMLSGVRNSLGQAPAQ